MQNQSHQKSFLNPTASTFNARGGPRPPFSTNAPRADAPAPPFEEAWTQYDGLGPVGGPKDPRLERNWRAPTGPAGRGGQARNMSNNSRIDRNFSRGTSPVRQPAYKRSKQMPQQQHQQQQQMNSHRIIRTGGNGGAFRNNNQGRGHLVSPVVFHPGGEIVDEAYLVRNYPQLKKEDYPSCPPALFSNPKSFLWDNKVASGARSTYASQRNGWFQCTVFIKMPDGDRVEAIGESMNKKTAEKIACQHLVLKLNQTGQLKGLIYGGVHHLAHDQNLLNEEQDAKMDIYDYCARYDTIPIITPIDLNRPGQKRAILEVIIEMPEQGIKASAKATERRVADILASVEFKRQAEDWHAKHGDEDILVKDVASVINSRNAKKFFEFFKIHNLNAVFTCETKPLRAKSKRISASMTEGQILYNGNPIGAPVEFGGKKNAETGAWVTAAVALKKEYPELFPQFIQALKMGNGEILKPVPATWCNIEQDSVVAMTDTLLSVRRIGLPPTEEEMALADEKAEDRRRYHARKLDPALATVKSKKMLEAHEEYLKDEKLAVLRQKRSELPMIQYTQQVLELVNNNEVSIIVGATGSGKTTQVPQILLEDAIRSGRGADCNVICTQPRRIAATSVAQRVSVERNEPLQKSIGYQVRFDAKLPLPGGSVVYCTTGILLQQLRNNPDEVLDGITHLVIDEVHERDIMIDYLLIILKRILKDRRMSGRAGVKVVLMSATMDTELFAGYFGGKDQDGNYVGCPHLSVPGRTFPVKEYYLEDIREQLRQYPANQLSLLREPDSRDYLSVEEHFVAPVGTVPASTAPSAAVSRVQSRAPSRAPSRGPSRAQSPGAGLDEDGDNATINWKQEVSIRSDGQATVSTEKEDAVVPIGLAALTLSHIVSTTKDGAVLVFLPGLDEILKVETALRDQRPLGIDFNDTSRFKIYMLHSSIPNQNEVFDDIPEGCRKIILSTNIAETSITIPDVKYVVDTGKLREKQYEQARRITQLVCTWVSKSNSKQRAGRAGRVQDGNYYALFSKARFESLRPTGLPEMLRSDLQEICLDIKLQGFKDPIGQFLSEAIEPPAPHAIDSSLTQLLALGAIDQDEKLTQLGHVLATMPVEPALGKMIILAVIFRCLDPILILGASAGGRDIFVNPPDKRQESTRAKHSFIRGTGSDHMGVINAFTQWRKIRDTEGQYPAHRFAEQNFLHRGSLKVLDQTAKQVEDILVDIGLIPRVRMNERLASQFGHPRLNTNSDSVPLIKALTLAGMYPNLAVCAGGRGFRTVSENFTMIHPSSSHYNGRDNTSVPIGQLITYTTKAKSNDGSSILLRQNTSSTALAAILFGGRLRAYGNTLEIDSWLPFKTRENQAKVTVEFKRCLDRLLAHAFRSLSKRTSGSAFLADDPARETFAQGIVEVLESDAGIRRNGGNRGFQQSAPQWSGGGDSYRPGSRGDNRDFPSLSSRPHSRNGDRYPQGPSRPDSRASRDFRPSVTDVRNDPNVRLDPKPGDRPNEQPRANNGPPSQYGGVADRYRPDPRIQGRWR